MAVGVTEIVSLAANRFVFVSKSPTIPSPLRSTLANTWAVPASEIREASMASWSTPMTFLFCEEAEIGRVEAASLAEDVGHRARQVAAEDQRRRAQRPQALVALLRRQGHAAVGGAVTHLDGVVVVEPARSAAGNLPRAATSPKRLLESQ